MFLKEKAKKDKEEPPALSPSSIRLGVKSMESPEEREANRREREEADMKPIKVKAMPMKRKAKPKATDATSDAKPVNGALGTLRRGALAPNLAREIENTHDQTFHDSRYYANVAGGKPHHIAWKNEKGRRRAILDRRSGLIDRASEKIELGNTWHSKNSAQGTGKKRIKMLVASRPMWRRKLWTIATTRPIKPIESLDECMPLSRESFQQFPDDEAKVFERPSTRRAAEPRDCGAERTTKKCEREAREERKRQAKHDADRTRQRRHSWDSQYNSWREDEEEEAPEVHDFRVRSEPNEIRDSELNSFSAPPNASFGEPHVVEERDGWKRIVVNLDAGVAATAIPSDLNLGRHVETLPQDISYKTGQLRRMKEELCFVERTATGPFGRPGPRRSSRPGLGSEARRHHIALEPARTVEAGKEYSAFMDKLYKEHDGGMIPVRMHNDLDRTRKR